MKIDMNSIVEPKPTENLIKRFEEDYEVNFPKKFKEFLLEYNGATPITNILPLDSNEYVIERFLCILEDYEEHEDGHYVIGVVISQIFDRLTDSEDIIGMDVIPIASLFGGDFICLDYRKKGIDYRENKNPIVVIWDHEESEEDSPATKKVANSVEEFFDMLIEDENS
ncbi:MAG: SMI1/KNR4 family protein [Clostridiales bacterium]|nr:SMI1/KNR4 family protein [Clostridiales bacterium]